MQKNYSIELNNDHLPADAARTDFFSFFLAHFIIIVIILFYFILFLFIIIIIIFVVVVVVCLAPLSTKSEA